MSAKAIYARITAQVPALGTRVYPLNVPPSLAPTYPLAVYLGEGPTPVSGAPETLSEVMRVTVVAEGYGTSRTIAKSVRDAIHLQSGTWGTVTVVRAFYDDGSEDTSQIAKTNLYATEQAFTVWYRA